MTCEENSNLENKLEAFRNCLLAGFKTVMQMLAVGSTYVLKMTYANHTL
jgi:hypothetical protein